MALAKFGGGVTQLSGAIGGSVYARNRSGAYVRANTKPINPNTSLQQAVRQAMADGVAAWAAVLSDANRTAWDLYAANVPVLNRLGDTVNLTGQNMFLRSDTVITQIGGTRVPAGPTDFSLPEGAGAMIATVSEATNQLSLTFSNAADWANEDGGALIVHCGQPQNPTRNFFAGPWRYAGKIDGDAVTPPSSPATIDLPFVATQGQNVWFYYRILRADGRVSNPFRFQTVVNA